MQRIDVKNEKLIAGMNVSDKINEIMSKLNDDTYTTWQVASLITKKYDYSQLDIERIVVKYVIRRLAILYKVREHKEVQEIENSIR